MLGEGILDEKELIDELVTLFFAGVDTSANSMLFLFLELARDQDSQDKCRIEVMDLLERRSEDGKLSHKIVSESTPYLEACFQESARLNPPVPHMPPRVLQSDLVLDENLTLPAGVRGMKHLFFFSHQFPVIPDMWCTHRSKQIYGENAEVFFPERMMDREKQVCDFYPFGAGPRRCVGDFSIFFFLGISFHCHKLFHFHSLSSNRRTFGAHEYAVDFHSCSE